MSAIHPLPYMATPDFGWSSVERVSPVKHALLRRSIFGALLAGVGSFSLSCSALAEHDSYALPPVPVTGAQPAPKLHVDAPLPEPLGRGVIILRYRADNLRFLPVFGPAALAVSPPVGHVHVTVDDAPWHWAATSGEPLIIQGLPVGPHKVLVQLADPTHMVIDSKTVNVTIPEHDAAHH